MRKSWNRMESIPVRELNDKELKQAIDDWAEGSQPLKRLLWGCYQNGVETAGCHSGHKRGVPYVDFRVDTSHREKLKHIIDAGLSIGNGQILMSFSGNPRSGPDWHRTNLLLSPLKVEDSRKFLRSLCKGVNNDEIMQDEAIESIIQICEFMEDKDSILDFRVTFAAGRYTISAECLGNNRDWEYYTKLFAKADMIQNIIPEWRGRRSDWVIESIGYENFTKAIKKLCKVLLENWTLKLPEEITEDMGETSKALVMRRKFGTDREGVEKLNKWLNEHKEPQMRDVNY